MSTAKKIYDWFSKRSSLTAFLFLFIIAGIAFSGRSFLSFNSLANLMRKAASDGGFLALGMTFVILIGQIDLSVGAILAMGGVIMALFGNTHPLLGIFLGLLVGAVCGFANGFMVAKLKISSWIATLAMMLGLRGIVLLITNKKPIPIRNDILAVLGNATFFNINVLVFILVALTLICMLIARNTKFGFGIYAVGGNEDAAKMMGLSVDKIKIGAFVLCGTFSALAGMLLGSRLNTCQPTAGDSWETTAIAMCALGGIKLSGGEGKFSGTFFGILIITIIKTMFNYAGFLNSWWQNIIMGILIMVSIGVQSELFQGKETKQIKKKANA